MARTRRANWKHWGKVALVAGALVLGYDFYKGHTKSAPVAGPRASAY